MRTKPLYSLLFCLLLGGLSSSSLAQSAYPVSVSAGTLLPPYSALLSEYGTVRASNISFTVTLNDPIEASRDVYFRISILNNGREIHRTKANFQDAPYTLFQYTPVVITGAELANYFKPENLTGSNAGTSNLLPEGFNQICLEVVDAQRQVVISNQACASGFIQLYDPPFLELPACHGELLMPARGSSTLFKWMPRHLGLPGAPNMVEYVLEIAELTPGIGNPNDAFAQAWTVGLRNTMATSWLWLETDPPLEVGKKYAWRVQAVDLSGSQGAFKNQGYSEICTFEVKRKVVPRFTINECHPDNTEYPVAPTYGPEATNLQPGETIFLGYFDLEVTDAYYSGSGYDGTGQIYIPFLKTNVSVSFQGLKLNQDNYVYGGTIQGDQDIIGSPTYGPDNYHQVDPEAYVSWLKRNGGRQNGPARPAPFMLDKILNQTDTANVMLFDFRFSPRNALVNGFSEMNGIAFDRYDIPLAPSGPQSDNALQLSSLVPDFLNALDPHLHLITEQSVVEWNCKGATSFGMKAYYEFEPEQARPSQETVQGPGIPMNGKAKALFSLPPGGNTDFIVEIDEIDTLMMNDPLPLLLAGRSVKFDFSPTENAPRMQYPDHYPGQEGVEWRGFLFEQGRLELPTEWDLTGTGRGFRMKRNGFIIDDQATYGSHKEDRQLLDLNRGRFGEWRFQVDSLAFVVDESKVDSFRFAGITGPQVSEPTVPYQGSFAAEDGAVVTEASAPYFVLNVSDTLHLPMWRGYLALDSLRSHLIGQPGTDPATGTRIFSGKPDLYGLLNITPTMADVDTIPENGPVIDSLRIQVDPLGDHDISTLGLMVEHFRIDHSENPEGQAFYLQSSPTGAPFTIGNAEMKLDFLVFPKREDVDIHGQPYDAQGFHIVDEEFPMQIKVWGIDPDGDGFHTFGKVELIPKALLGPDQPFICDCQPSADVQCEPESASGGSSPIQVGDVVVIGGFKMLIENPGFAKLRIPFLKRNVDVTTSADLTADADGIAISGSATSVYDSGLTGGNSDLTGVEFTQDMLDALIANTEGTQFPISVTEQIINSAAEVDDVIDIPEEFFLTRMHFEPDGAESDGLLVKKTSTDKYLLFLGEAFDTRINGFNFPEISFFLLKTVSL